MPNPPTQDRESGESADVTTQTDESVWQTGAQAGRLRPRKTAEIDEIREIRTFDSLENWRDAVTKRWSPDVFKRTEIVYGGDILNTKDDVLIMIPVQKDTEDTDNGRIWKCFPELRDTREEYVTLVRSTRIRSKEEATTEKKIVKMIIDASEEDLWEKDKRAKEEAEVDGYDKTAFQQPPGISIANFRKMLECIYQDSNATVYIYGKTREGKGTASTRKSSLEIGIHMP